MNEIILASQSPRRKMLLRNLIDPFFVVNADIDEGQVQGETPAEFVLRLAEEKALKGGQNLITSDLNHAYVIGADTIVVDGEEILGKPSDQADAIRVLEQLKGRTHQVLSGIALHDLSRNETRTRLVCTEVEMREYTEDEIQKYVNSGDPLDKAGSYGIQNPDFDPAPNLAGCFANVMGLPLCHLAVLMAQMEIEPDQRVAHKCQTSINYQCPIHHEVLSELKDL